MDVRPLKVPPRRAEIPSFAKERARLTACSSDSIEQGPAIRHNVLSPARRGKKEALSDVKLVLTGSSINRITGFCELVTQEVVILFLLDVNCEPFTN